MNFLKVVLVSSKYSRNVGMVSRILSNYGIDEMILVSPKCELDEVARQGAAQGQGPLRETRIYPTWNEFIETEPEGLRVAFSRRQGRRRASTPLRDLLDEDVVKTDRPTYLIFGAEDHGLSAEDLELVHRMAYFDLPGELQSMNLSHSVLIAIENFYLKFGQVKLEGFKKERIKDPSPSLRLWLETLNFDLNSQPRWNMLTMLKQLILRASPTNEELDKLDSLIQQTVRKIKE